MYAVIGESCVFMRLVVFLIGIYVVTVPSGWVVDFVLKAREKSLARKGHVLKSENVSEIIGGQRLQEDQESQSSWAESPRMLGWLERYLIYLFVFWGEFTAVGFLIAAKGTFRLVGLPSESLKSESEKVLVGSLFSFALGLSISAAFKWLYSHV